MRQPQIKQLSDPEAFKTRLNVCINEMKASYPKANSVIIRELFTLHNMYYLRQETGMHCGACIKRVYDIMTKLNNELTNG